MTPPLSAPLATMNIPTFQTLAAGWDWSRFGIGLTVVVFGGICLLLVLAILIQKPQGGGLSGAFGAGASGSGQTAFGTKTGDALTWMTIIIFLVYLGAAIGMNYAMRPMDSAPSGGNASGVPTPGKVPPGDKSVPEKPATTAPANTPSATPPADKPAETPPAATSTINVKPAETPAATPGAAPVTPAPIAPAPIAPPPGAPAANPPANTPPATGTPATNPPAAPPK